MTNAHKNLLAIAIALVALTAGAHFYFLSGHIKYNNSLREENKKTREALRERNASWILEPAYLSNLNKQYSKHQGDRFGEAHEVLKRANEQFQKLFDEHGNDITVEEWRKGVTNTAYSDLYQQTLERLSGKRIYLNEEVLGLKQQEVMAFENLYRRIAHIYVVGQVADLARKHALNFSDADMATQALTEIKGLTFSRGKPPAIIRAKKVRSYYYRVGTKRSATPFMDEFPVEIQVQGKMRDLCNFLQDLTAGNNFLPLDRIMVKQIGADRFDNLNQARRPSDIVEAIITCSGFLILEDMDKMKKKQFDIDRGKSTWQPGA